MTRTNPNDVNRDDDEPRRFRVTRKRIGKIQFIDPKGEYGFILAEDFREDVFFHRTSWEGESIGATTSPGLSPELVGRIIEFELDEEVFQRDQKLRAAVVRLTRRPIGRKLSGRDATFQIVTHHPKARRKRPDWRK